MLPEFPEIKMLIERALNKNLRAEIRNDPLLSRFGEYHFSEGDKWEVEQEDGSIEKREFTKIEGKVSISSKDVVTKGLGAFAASQLQIAEEIKSKQTEMLIKEFKNTAEQSGNILDNRNRPFTFDTFITLLEKVTIEFDNDGRAILPSLVVAPELAEKLAKEIPKWEADLKNKERYDKLLEKKREEWNDRESNRKLVD